MPVAKYLRHYAEPHCQQLPQPKPARQVLVIPCRDETELLQQRLQSLLAHNADTLVILVVNQPQSQTDCSLNAQFVSRLGGDPLAGGQLLDWHHGQVLVLDHFTPDKRLPGKQGVGMARKLGADAACHFIHHGLVHSPWIHMSDADVQWPQNYFAIEPAPDSAVAMYPFYHQPRPGPSGIAVAVYELSLRYYVAGLRYAGSAYSYYSLGSTLAINHQNYAAVRGFAQRAAAEDFHTLNKLRKTGAIELLQQPRLLIDDRDSLRAPFGTGPKVVALQQQGNPMQQALFYHPNCFEMLRQSLSVLTDLPAGCSEQQALEILQQLPAPAFRALQFAGIERSLQHALRQSTSQTALQQHLRNGFDALATLRFIHHLRDQHLPSISAELLLQQDNFFSRELAPLLHRAPIQSPAEQLRLLNLHLP